MCVLNKYKSFSNRIITVGGDGEELSRYSTKFQGLLWLCAPPCSVWKENKPIAANQASYGTEPGVSLWACLIEYEVLSRMQCLHVKARRRDRIFGESSSNAHIKTWTEKGLKLPFLYELADCASGRLAGQHWMNFAWTYRCDWDRSPAISLQV